MFSGTFFLFLFIMLLTTRMAALSQRYRNDGSVVFNIKYFIIAFFVHWIFIAFTKIGVDHDSYIAIIEYDSIRRLRLGQEIAFNGLCYILQKWIGNAELVLWLIKSITLLIFYFSFYLLRKKANLEYVVAAYNAWIYLFSFCIIAHALAVSIIMLAVVLVIQQEKWYLPVFLAVVASMVHASALVMLVAILGLTILNKASIRIGVFLMFILLIVSILVVENSNVIFHSLVSGVDAFGDYAVYDASKNEGSGIFNYIIFAYILIVLLMPAIMSSMSKEERNAYVVFYIFSLTSSILGYFLGTARLNHYAVALYGVSIPVYFHQMQNHIVKSKYFINFSLQKVSWTLYVLFVAFASIKTRTAPMSSSLMDHYQFFNPF